MRSPRHDTSYPTLLLHNTAGCFIYYNDVDPSFFHGSAATPPAAIDNTSENSNASFTTLPSEHFIYYSSSQKGKYLSQQLPHQLQNPLLSQASPNKPPNGSHPHLQPAPLLPTPKPRQRQQLHHSPPPRPPNPTPKRTLPPNPLLNRNPPRPPHLPLRHPIPPLHPRHPNPQHPPPPLPTPRLRRSNTRT